MERTKDWNARRILITGGSAGLGRALAREAALRGARVVVVARSADRLRDLEQEADLHTLVADVSDPSEASRIAGEAMALLGGVDLLINNASYLGETPLPVMMDTRDSDLARVFETNLFGPVRLTRAVLPDMLLRGSGLVVNISSDAAVNGYARWGGYSASKAALDHLSRVWDEEVKDRGVRFLSLDPGDMDTEMHRQALPDADPAGLRRPADVARDVLDFLAFSTGQASVRLGANEWRAASCNRES